MSGKLSLFITKVSRRIFPHNSNCQPLVVSFHILIVASFLRTHNIFIEKLISLVNVNTVVGGF